MEAGMKKIFAAFVFIGVMTATLFFVAGCGGGKTSDERARKEKPADIVVKNGESIQDAVKKAKEGAVIEVEPGIYKETVSVDKHNITLRGIVRGNERPVIEGENKLNDGILASGDNFTVSGFEIRNFKANGITTQGSDDLKISDIVVVNTGVYGIFPVESENVLVEKCSVTGIRDAGIYVSVSKNSIVRNNEVFGNVAGIEMENSSDAVIENNNTHDNTGGILVFVLPGKTLKKGERTIVRNNAVVNNNTKNFGDPKSIVGKVPAGVGILVMAADDTVIMDNVIKGNESFGAAMVELDILEDAKRDEDVEPNPDRTQILQNTYEKNGLKAHGMVKDMLGKGADIVWSGTGEGNCAVKTKGVTLIGAESLPECAADAKKTAEEKAKAIEVAVKTGKAKADETPKTASVPQAAKDIPAGAVKVEIVSMAYKPKHVKIKAGQTVAWLNKDNMTHTVTSGKGTAPDANPMLNSGFMGPYTVYTHTFNKPGKFSYLCLPHLYQESMRDATVTVEK